MKTNRLLLANLPWWVNEPDGLRRGVRAGSRWPFTCKATFAPDNFSLGSYTPYPYFMGCAAGWAKAHLEDTEVVFRDSIARGESNASFGAFWDKYKPTHVVIESSGASWPVDKQWIAQMKKSNVKIAVAGPAARELQKMDDGTPVDCWILGEYEHGTVAFVRGATGILAHSFLSKDEMATQPFPLFDDEVYHHYYDANPKGTLWPELTVWGSRGCCYLCNFCSFPATMTNNDPLGLGGRKVRLYPGHWIKSFITHARLGREFRSVRFDGDTENISDRHTLDICAAMKSIGLPWTMMCRADTVSNSTWEAMRDAGCVGVKIGMESGSQRVIDEIVKKKLDLAEAIKTCRFIRSLGMSVHTTWTVGLPGETKEEADLTLATIGHLYETGATTTHQLSGTAELPGTPMSQGIKDASYLASDDGQKKVEQLFQK